ncbi:MAG: ribulose-phosphate 3-epimerase [Candidatus Diapherotrites archaeon]|nr:ribulose-phosphate 3-epimerase [Candidatus Diapherotrites archaeon]
MTKKILLSPSILSADFGRINEEIALVEGHSDLIHIDVMDGRFVPNITFGQAVLAKMKSKKPFDVHLMIVEPEKYIKDFVDAGAERISVHAEATQHLHRTIQLIKNCGVKASVALNPATPLSAIENVLDDLDMVLLMTVNPGFGGQKFIESVLPKIQQLRKLRPELDIEVDGGISPETVKRVVDAGANVLVAGNAIFGQKDRIKAIQDLLAGLK